MWHGLPNDIIMRNVIYAELTKRNKIKLKSAPFLDANQFAKAATFLREGTFFIGGWARASDGRVLSKFFTNWEGSNLFSSQPGEGHSFLARKTLLHVASIL